MIVVGRPRCVNKGLNVRRGDDARAVLGSDARLTWTVEAASHFDAMSRYYDHMGWGEYATDQPWDRQTYAEHGWE